MKTLKIWNGRWYEKNKTKHAYICAYSRTDACRLLAIISGTNPSYWQAEMRDYFSEGCWGNMMEGITPERGVWISDDSHREKPMRRI
jgi:hypothetical protein